MLDYRNDIINLMKATDKSENSLKQSMVALKLVCKMYDENTKLEEKLKDLADKDDESDKASNRLEEKEVSSSEETNETTKSSNEDISSNEAIASTDSDDNSEAKEIAEEKAKANLNKKVLQNQQKYSVKISLPELPKINKTAPIEEPKTEFFKVRRKLLGSEAVDDLGHTVQYFNEYTTRQFNIENGDTVELSTKYDFSGNRRIVNVSHHPEPLGSDREIVEFGPAVVQRDNFGLYVEKDPNGDYLSSVNPEKARYYIDLSIINSFSIKENDLITIVWYKSSPEYIKVRWRYEADSIPKVEEKTPKTSKGKGRYKKLLHLKEQENKDKESKTSSEDYEPRIKFDLNKKRVTIVVGDKGLTANLDKVIEAHNGTCRIIELKRPADALRAAKESDYVILIQSYIKHGISQMLINTRNRNYSIAMATTSGQLAVEKALYRARYKLNVTDADNIEYPFIEESAQD